MTLQYLEATQINLFLFWPRDLNEIRNIQMILDKVFCVTLIPRAVKNIQERFTFYVAKIYFLCGVIDDILWFL